MSLFPVTRTSIGRSGDKCCLGNTFPGSKQGRGKCSPGRFFGPRADLRIIFPTPPGRLAGRLPTFSLIFGTGELIHGSSCLSECRRSRSALGDGTSRTRTHQDFGSPLRSRPMAGSAPVVLSGIFVLVIGFLPAPSAVVPAHRGCRGVKALLEPGYQKTWRPRPDR